jgi:hypothetical protein
MDREASVTGGICHMSDERRQATNHGRRAAWEVMSGAGRAILPWLLAGVAVLSLSGSLSLAAPVAPTATVAYDPTIAAILAQVTTQTLSAEVAGLSGERPITVAGTLYTLTTRNSYQTVPISMATRYAYEQFLAAGLTATYHSYVYNGQRWRNVIAEQPGRQDPDRVYLLTAHLDDMPSGTVAPGADDNGSGSAAVIVAARLLADRDYLSYTLRFVLFTGEEQGLRGSAAYAALCQSRGEDIRGVVNLDMIAYNSDAQPIIDLHGSSTVSPSLQLTRLFSDVVTVYGLNLQPDRWVDNWVIQYSDQWSFLQRGYPAILAIEDDDDFTPYYHTVNDRLSTLDLDYYADFARAAIGTVAHLVHLNEGVLSGTVRALDTGLPLAGSRVEAAADWAGHTYTAVTGADGRYALIAPAGQVTVTVRADHGGYFDVILPGVPVASSSVTTLDVDLPPWPRLYLPWVSREP